MKTREFTSVFDAIRPLGESHDPSVLNAALKALCDCLRADAVGICNPVQPSTDVSYPPGHAAGRSPAWLRDERLLAQLQFSMTAGAVDDAQGEWLVAVVNSALIVWAQRSAERGWDDNDRWSLMAAGQAIERWRGQAPNHLHDNLEQAAVVASRLCHDFGNYLTGVLGFTELGLSQATPNSVLHRYLLEVLQSAQKGADWIHRLHWFCRRAGAPVWPTPILDVLIEETHRYGPTPKLRFEIDAAADLPLADIEAAALRTILTELINNAREATTQETVVTITARSVALSGAHARALLGSPGAGEFIELTVSDTGPGMALEHRSKLFRELFLSTKPRHRGLGLLIVYGKMQRFHGGLELVAPPSGRGFAVRLLLPVAGVSGPPFRSGDSPKVLAVHPNPLCLETMRRILEARGSRVTIATSADAALNTVMTPGNVFELIVTETALPNRSGFSLARKVRDYASDTAFLFVQAQSVMNNLDEDAALKRFPILRGPIDVRIFVDGVQSALALGSA